MLRTLGGRNIGKCRLRAHQHPLSPPLSNLLEPARAHPMQNVQGKTRASPRDERVLGDELGDVWGCVLKIGCFVHRFLISSPDLRIDAGFSPETPSSVHRFLISGPDLRIDARFSPETAQRLHRFLISGPDLGIDARKPSRIAQRLHRFLISRPDLRIAAAPSLLQRRTARLQRSRGVQAGTGCHEGGIILSKKPPEWRLFLPQQRSASDSNFRCCS